MTTDSISRLYITVHPDRTRRRWRPWNAYVSTRSAVYCASLHIIQRRRCWNLYTNAINHRDATVIHV